MELPRRERNEAASGDNYRFVCLVPGLATDLHDSGFRYIDLIGMRGGVGGAEVWERLGSCDHVWEQQKFAVPSIAGGLSIDCTAGGVFRLYTFGGLVGVGEVHSTAFVWAVPEPWFRRQEEGGF